MKTTTAKKDDYSAIRNLWDICFDEDSTQWRDWYFKSRYNPQYANLLYKDNELISMVHMNPYMLMLNGNCIKTAAMAGVATNPKFRKQGHAQKLIKHSIQKAYCDGYYYSFLRPFNYEFYEKYGYRCTYKTYSYEIQYKKGNELPEDFEIFPYTIDYTNTLCSIYHIAMQNSNGYVARDAHYFSDYIESFLVDECEVNIFKHNHNTGYYIYNKDSQKVEELFYTGNLTESYRLICSHLQHTVNIDNQPYINTSDENIKAKQKKHCMVRIVNFVKLIEKYKFTDSSIIITIKDDIIKENNHTFLITAKNSVTTINPTNADCDITMNINDVSALIACSYYQPIALDEYFTSRCICKSSFIVEEC